MTPDERQMIADLFERLRSYGPVDKDREADQFITQLTRQTPDAAYMLVQSVLVQENTLQETGNRVQELEDQVRYLEDQLQQRQAPAPAAGRWGGSFLGGSRGAPQPQQQRSAGQSVPVTNRSTGFGQAPAAPPPASSPWGGRQAGYQQPGQMQPQAQAGGGGGFMRSAMATAAGVAGGIFAANAIKDMMGGNSGQAQAGQASSQDASSQEASPYEVNQDQSQADSSYGYQQPEDNDPGNTDWGGGGGDGGDMGL